MSNCIIWKYGLVALTAKGHDFDEGQHEKHEVATWDYATMSAFA
jgi:hypothetical protein